MFGAVHKRGRYSVRVSVPLASSCNCIRWCQVYIDRDIHRTRSDVHCIDCIYNEHTAAIRLRQQTLDKQLEMSEFE
jgi:hypothetical protein